MASQDETVSREQIADILARARHNGWRSLFATLEHQEPVLAAYALATADALSQKLQMYGVPRGLILLIHTEVILAELVCIESMRQGSRELWKDFLNEPERR